MYKYISWPWTYMKTGGRGGIPPERIFKTPLPKSPKPPRNFLPFLCSKICKIFLKKLKIFGKIFGRKKSSSQIGLKRAEMQ